NPAKFHLSSQPPTATISDINVTTILFISNRAPPHHPHTTFAPLTAAATYSDNPSLPSPATTWIHHIITFTIHCDTTTKIISPFVTITPHHHATIAPPFPAVVAVVAGYRAARRQTTIVVAVGRRYNHHSRTLWCQVVMTQPS
nr:hypothetical protein [Tanacetum cinerariifolium]